jgi:hypothetical protein
VLPAFVYCDVTIFQNKFQNYVVKFSSSFKLNFAARSSFWYRFAVPFCVIVNIS